MVQLWDKSYRDIEAISDGWTEKHGQLGCNISETKLLGDRFSSEGARYIQSSSYLTLLLLQIA